MARLRSEFFKYIRVPKAYLAELREIAERKNSTIQELSAIGLNLVKNNDIPEWVRHVPLKNVVARMRAERRLRVPGTEYEQVVGVLSEVEGIPKALAKVIVLISAVYYLRQHVDRERAIAFAQKMLGERSDKV